MHWNKKIACRERLYLSDHIFLLKFVQEFELLRQKFTNLEDFEEKRAAINERITQDILFGNCLRDLNNKKLGLTDIKSCFANMKAKELI
jgi:hypothetical protein